MTPSQVDSRHPPMQPGWIDRPHRVLPIGDLALESGEVIRDCELVYVVHGSANEHAPVVLVVTAIGSTHHRLDFLIGPGQALDTRHCTVIAVDALGNGLSTSPSNSEHQSGLRFPRFTIRDMVASQAALLGRLGVDRLAAVVGASMGGMQALQWAVSRPLPVERVVALTPMARTSPWSIAVNEAARRALAAGMGGRIAFVDPDPDPDAQPEAGSPAGWEAWVPLMQLLASRTPAQVDQQFEDSPRAVIDWVARRCQWWGAQRVAPLDWLYQSWAYDAHDVGTTPGFGGDTAAALASIAVPTLIAAPPLDLYNPAHAARWAADRIAGCRLVTLDSHWGHQAATAADEGSVALLQREIAAFLLPGR